MTLQSQNIRLLPVQSYHLFSYLLLAMLITFAYATAFPNVFIYDDNAFLSYINQNLGWSERVQKIFGSLLFKKGRQFTELTFYLHNSMGSGTPSEFLLVNLILHYCNCLLLYNLLLKLANKDPHQGIAQNFKLWQLHGCAFISVTLFAVHPLMVATVTYITQRSLLLLTFFILNSLFVVMQGLQKNNRLSYTLFLAVVYLFLFQLSLQSKEVGLLMPLYSILFWIVYHALNFVHKIKLNQRTLILLAAMLAGVAILAYDLYSHNFYIHNIADLPWGPWDQFSGMGIVTAKEIFLLFWPALNQMSMDHYFDPLQFSTLIKILALLFHTSILASAVYFLILGGKNQILQNGTDRTRFEAKLKLNFTSLYCLAIGWYYLSQGPFFVFQELHLFVEYKTYPANVGFAFLIMFLCLNFLSIKWLKIYTVGAMLIILLLCLQTRQRNQLFNSFLAFWSDIASKQPDQERAFNNIGYYYLAQEEMELAKVYFYKVLQVNPYNELGISNLANYYLKKNDFLAAVVQLEMLEFLLRSKSSSLSKIDELAHNESNRFKMRIQSNILLGQIYHIVGQDQIAAKYFKNALDLDPKNIITLKEFGSILMAMGHQEEGRKLLQQALEEIDAK